MKHFAAILFFVCCSAAFAENIEARITAAQPSRDGFHFSVAAVPIERSLGSPAVFCVVVAITPPQKSAGSKGAYVEVWKEKSFYFSTALASCSADDFPITLRDRIPIHDSILFTFKIGAECLRDSWFGYQLPRTGEMGEPVNCVVMLSEFLREPNHSSTAQRP